jgi:hypothetical protein
MGKAGRGGWGLVLQGVTCCPTGVQKAGVVVSLLQLVDILVNKERERERERDVRNV